MSELNLGTNGEKIIVFYTFKDKREFENFKSGSEAMISGSVLQSSLFVIFLADATQKVQLPDTIRFRYISKTDFNFLGVLKDKELREMLKAKFDILLAMGEFDPSGVKMMNKITARKKIVSSLTEGIKFDIRLNSSSVRIEQITSFAKETLGRIQS